MIGVDPEGSILADGQVMWKAPSNGEDGEPGEEEKKEPKEGFYQVSLFVRSFAGSTRLVGDWDSWEPCLGVEDRHPQS